MPSLTQNTNLPESRPLWRNNTWLLTISPCVNLSNCNEKNYGVRRKISNAHKIIWPRRTALKRLLDIQSSVIRTSSPYLNSLITLGASEILHISNLFFGRRVNNFTIADGSSFNYDVIIIISDIWVMKPEIIWGEKSVCISYNVERLIDHPDWFVIIHCEINQIRDKPKNLLMTQFTYTLQWED